MRFDIMICQLGEVAFEVNSVLLSGGRLNEAPSQ